MRSLIHLLVGFVAFLGLLFLQRATAAEAGPEKIQSVPLELKTKTGTLYGTLDLPAGRGPFPVALLIGGSGPTDRDGNNHLGLKTDAYKMLGQELARRGIAVVRYDKRGIAASNKAMTREEDLRFDTYVADAVAWVELLRKDPRFRGVAVIGQSEGSLIGMIAARRTNVEAFVSISGAGRPAPVVLREQLGKSRFTPELKTRAFKILDDLSAGRTVADPPEELAALFRPSVQPYLISWFKYDPVREIARLTIPVLIVQGTDDIQISVAEAKLLAAARKNTRLLVIGGMTHTLKRIASPKEQISTYTDPSLPLVRKMVNEIANFLRRAVARKT